MPHGPWRKPDPPPTGDDGENSSHGPAGFCGDFSALAKPTILAGRRPARRAPSRDLSTRYGADYTIVPSPRERSADPAQPATLQDRRVALVVTDQRMPEMTGIEMLEDVRRLSPDQAAPPHRLRRHRRRDQGDQRHRAGLLPVQAVGPTRGAPLPRRRRAPPGLEQQLPAGDAGGPRRAPVGRPHLRGEDLPHPQPRALPLARREHDPQANRLLGLAGFGDLDAARLPVVVMPSGNALVSPRTSSSRTPWAFGHRRNSRCTTSASSGPGPPDWPRRWRRQRVSRR